MKTNLAVIRGIGYSRLERWSQRLLTECLAVDGVIDALSAHTAITSVAPTNTRFVVAAGGFEGATNPSYVFTIQDSGQVRQVRRMSTCSTLLWATC